MRRWRTSLGVSLSPRAASTATEGLAAPSCERTDIPLEFRRCRVVTGSGSQTRGFVCGRAADPNGRWHVLACREHGWEGATGCAGSLCARCCRILLRERKGIAVLGGPADGVLPGRGATAAGGRRAGQRARRDQGPFFGCGSPIPPALEDLTVLDLGCGSWRDLFRALPAGRRARPSDRGRHDRRATRRRSPVSRLPHAAVRLCQRGVRRGVPK